MFATCFQTAVDRLTCSCKPGYHGDGYYCQMIDVCATNNGGCGVNSTCLFTAPVSLCIMLFHFFTVSWLREDKGAKSGMQSNSAVFIRS